MGKCQRTGLREDVAEDDIRTTGQETTLTKG